MAVHNSPDWKRIEEVFLQAAELSGQDRARCLAKECAGDSGLQTEVESLLAAEEEGKGAPHQRCQPRG